MECFAPHRFGQNMARASKVPNTNVGLKQAFTRLIGICGSIGGEKAGILVTSFWEKALNSGLSGLWIISTLGNFPPAVVGERREGGRKKGQKNGKAVKAFLSADEHR